MGIRGLNTIIKKFSENSVTENNISKYKNSKVAIDCSILLYKFRYASKNENSHLVGIVNRIKFYIMNDILPVFIFDGVPPDAKKHIIQKRHAAKEKLYVRLEELNARIPNTPEEEAFIHEEIQKISSQLIVIKKTHVDDCKKMLELCGVPYFTAPEDAEKYCAFLQKNGLVDYTITDDTDAMTFGCEKILKTHINKKIVEIDLKSILKNFQMTYEMFVDFCILSGCDYTETISQIGPQSSFTLIKKHKNIEEVLLKLDKNTDNFDYKTARNIFINNNYEIVEDISMKPSNKTELLNFLTQNNFKENVIFKLFKILI